MDEGSFTEGYEEQKCYLKTVAYDEYEITSYIFTAAIKDKANLSYRIHSRL